jgi:hypothetical protein
MFREGNVFQMSFLAIETRLNRTECFSLERPGPVRGRRQTRAGMGSRKSMRVPWPGALDTDGR